MKSLPRDATGGRKRGETSISPLLSSNLLPQAPISQTCLEATRWGACSVEVPVSQNGAGKACGKEQKANRG